MGMARGGDGDLGFIHAGEGFLIGLFDA